MLTCWFTAQSFTSDCMGATSGQFKSHQIQLELTGCFCLRFSEVSQVLLSMSPPSSSLLPPLLPSFSPSSALYIGPVLDSRRQLKQKQRKKTDHQQEDSDSSVNDECVCAGSGSGPGSDPLCRPVSISGGSAAQPDPRPSAGVSFHHPN